MLSLALASGFKQSSQTSSPRVASNPEIDFNQLADSFYLNLLPTVKVQEISHKYLDAWLLLKSQEVEQPWAPCPASLPTCQISQS